MTRVEMKEFKKKRFRKDFSVLALSLVLITVGFAIYLCTCQSTNGDPRRVDISGSPVFYRVDRPLINVSTLSNNGVSEIDENAESDIVPYEEPKPTAVEEFKSYYTYTEDELDLLSRLIYSEGGSESYETKLKIGSVVMNRVSDLDSPDFPDTIREVIYQENQFAVTTIKINGVTMIDRPADEDSKKAAKEILDYGSILPSDVQVFYAEGECEGNWVTTRKVYEVSDNTVFAYIYSDKN